jgi:hypothetical protein
VNETVFDTEQDRYLVITTGWEATTGASTSIWCIYFNLVHLDIINGKVLPISGF